MITYLKTAAHAPKANDPEVRDVVAGILLDVEREGEAAVRRYSERFDHWSPERFVMTPDDIERRIAEVPAELRAHIDLAAEQIKRFAQAQLATLTDLEISTLPGIVLGHRHIPVQAVGAYSPGGRYPLIASSLMTTVVPRVAGVERIVCAAPPIDENGIDPAMLYAMCTGGADAIICVGGAQGLAALAFGIEDVGPVDMIVGAGNAYVAEAKRQLFGRVGIDLLAGPTEITVIADDAADPDLIASDIVGQLEHGPTSVGWLVSTSEEVARLAIAASFRPPPWPPTRGATTARSSSATPERRRPRCRTGSRASTSRFTPPSLIGTSRISATTARCSSAMRRPSPTGTRVSAPITSCPRRARPGTRGDCGSASSSRR
jgi:sulfopropanediol 3-dehydrogenase